MAEQDGGHDELTGSRGDFEALRLLATRMLWSYFPGDLESPEDVRLIVGALPDTLPVDVPLPDGCRVVGSMVRGRREISIVLDSDQPAEQVLGFYRERLTAAGWRVPTLPGHGGFTSGFMDRRAIYCWGSRGPALYVYARPLSGGPTDVRLDLHLDARHSPCGQRFMGPEMENLIPFLSPPTGGRQSPEGGGGGGDSWRSYATLETDLDLAAVAEHYARQLEQAGWTRMGAGQDSSLAWNTGRSETRTINRGAACSSY